MSLAVIYFGFARARAAEPALTRSVLFAAHRQIVARHRAFCNGQFPWGPLSVLMFCTVSGPETICHACFPGVGFREIPTLPASDTREAEIFSTMTCPHRFPMCVRRDHPRVGRVDINLIFPRRIENGQALMGPNPCQRCSATAVSALFAS